MMSACGLTPGPERLVVLLLLLLASAAGCRSLVEPGAEVRRAPERVLAATITEADGAPVVFTQVIFSNSAYVSRDPYVRNVPVSPSGAFSVPLPRDFEGYFDLNFKYTALATTGEFLYLGLEDTGESLDVVLDLVPMFGRIGFPEGLEGVEFTSNAVRIYRDDRRPSNYGSYEHILFPEIDETGEMETLIPAGTWRVSMWCSPCGVFSTLRTGLVEEFEGGSIDTILDMTSFTLTPRMPAGWELPLELRFEVRGLGGQWAIQPVELSPAGARLWGFTGEANLDIYWPDSIRAQYRLISPVEEHEWIDLRTPLDLTLVLPPRVLRLRSLDDGVALEGVRWEVEQNGYSTNIESDATGTAVYFCENGRYRVQARDGTRTQSHVLTVDGDTEFTVDFADESANVRH